MADGTHLDACNVGTTREARQASKCNNGLICDRNAKMCIYSNETACKPGFSCGIGKECVGTDGRKTDGNGICATMAGTVENNPISQALCNAYGFITGKIGRTIIVLVIFVTGITFYLGKVSWGTVAAIIIGAGLCFGGPAIVSIIVGGASC